MKKLLIFLAFIFAFIIITESCNYMKPDVAKAIEETKQTELMEKQNELLKQQVDALNRIATSLEKK